MHRLTYTCHYDIIRVSSELSDSLPFVTCLLLTFKLYRSCHTMEICLVQEMHESPETHKPHVQTK